MDLSTRRMDEMTSREIELYFENGGDLIFIPFGPISGHGAFTPMGIHGHWAQALSVLLAEKANGLVFPVVNTCFAGATRTFRGTVSFPIPEQAAALTRIAETLLGQGFKRVVLVAGTWPENTGGYVAAREVFDRTEKPVWSITAAHLLETPEVKQLYDSYPGKFGETLIGLASLKILGRERPIPYPKWASERKNEGKDHPGDVCADIGELRKWGSQVGFRYHEEGNHGNHGTAGLKHNGMSDVDLTVRVLDRCADLVLPVLNNLGRYAEWLDSQPCRFIVPTERLEGAT